MNIVPVCDNNISMQGKNNNPSWIKKQIRRIEQKMLDAVPKHTSKERENSIKKWDNTTHAVSHPMWNRGIVGATALLTQPAIDYYNHRVDDETRTVSRNRTIAKIIAGTGVGMFVVRGPVYKLVEKMTNPEGESKWSTILLPKKYINKLKGKANETALKNVRKATSMLLALMAMCVTNFVLDAPLTNFLSNYFNEKSGIKNKNSSTEGNHD